MMCADAERRVNRFHDIGPRRTLRLSVLVCFMGMVGGLFGCGANQKVVGATPDQNIVEYKNQGESGTLEVSAADNGARSSISTSTMSRSNSGADSWELVTGESLAAFDGREIGSSTDDNN